MDNSVAERIKSDIESNDVVLYMKGTPVFPQCGFSSTVVQVLTHLGVKFKGVDVLTDPSIREGIKQFSNWPTIPQLYVKGEFLGGCDIVRELESIFFFKKKKSNTKKYKRVKQCDEVSVGLILTTSAFSQTLNLCEHISFFDRKYAGWHAEQGNLNGERTGKN
jgi:monothiol glutaredoxin